MNSKNQSPSPTATATVLAHGANTNQQRSENAEQYHCFAKNMMPATQWGKHQHRTADQESAFTMAPIRRSRIRLRRLPKASTLGACIRPDFLRPYAGGCGACHRAHHPSNVPVPAPTCRFCPLSVPGRNAGWSGAQSLPERISDNRAPERVVVSWTPG